MTASLCAAASYLLLCEAEREPSRAWSVFLRINAALFAGAWLILMIEDIGGALL